jgi:cold shock CspA family protein
VKWFDVKKGFGFITPEAGGPDVFVHQSEVHSPGFRSLADGEEVEFKLVTQDDGRFRAADVTGRFREGTRVNFTQIKDGRHQKEDAVPEG